MASLYNSNKTHHTSPSQRRYRDELSLATAKEGHESEEVESRRGVAATKGAVFLALVGRDECRRELFRAAKLHHLRGTCTAEMVFKNHVDDESRSYEQYQKQVDDYAFFNDLLAKERSYKEHDEREGREQDDNLRRSVDDFGCKELFEIEAVIVKEVADSKIYLGKECKEHTERYR